MLYYNTLLLHKIDQIKMSGTSRELSSVVEENDNFELIDDEDVFERIKTLIRTKVT